MFHMGFFYLYCCIVHVVTIISLIPTHAHYYTLKKIAPTCFGPYTIYGHLQGAHEQCFTNTLTYHAHYKTLYDQISPGQELQARAHAHTHTHNR